MGDASTKSRRRRSPRLAKAVEVRVAGRGENGEVLVEDARTRDISKHGASLLTRHSYPLGSPIAVRRPDAPPMRARVCSSKVLDDGLREVGIEFVGEEGRWDLEFPRDWEDFYRGRRPVEEAQEAARQAENRQRLLSSDTAAEALLQKTDSLRSQAEAMLAEFAAQVEAARNKNTSALAAQVESFQAWKSILEGETRAQLEEARARIAEHAQRVTEQLDGEAEDLRRRVRELAGQCAAELQAGERHFQEVRLEEAQKAAKMVARVSAQLDAQRQQIGELDAQAARWRESSAEGLARLSDEVAAMVHQAAGSVQEMSLAAVQEFRRRIPEMGREMEEYFSGFLAEQRAGAARWIEQAVAGLRDTITALEVQRRSALEEQSGRATEAFQEALKQRLADFDRFADGIATPLEARLERARTTAAQLGSAAEHVVAAAREELNSTASEAARDLARQVAARIAEFSQAEEETRKRLAAAAEAGQQSALESTRRLDQTALDLHALNADLQRQAAARRQDLDGLFQGFTTVLAQRKEALDKLLESVDRGRAELRDSIAVLRANAEDALARLQRATADHEVALRGCATDLERRLRDASAAEEAELRGRIAGFLASSRAAFAESIEQAAGQTRQQLRSRLEEELQGAAARIPEMLQALDRCLEENSRALREESQAHQQGLAATRAAIDQQTAAAAEQLARRTVQGEESLRQAQVQAQTAIEDQQSRTAAVAADILKEIEQQRLAAARAHAEMERDIRERRAAMEKQFAALAAGLDEKRGALDSFYAFVEQTRNAWSKNVAALDRRMDDSRATVESLERQLSAALEKKATALTAQMEAALRQALESAHRELDAIRAADEEVFSNRLQALCQEAASHTVRTMEQSGNSAALTLDRTMQKERKEHERRAQELTARVEEQLRLQAQAFRDAAAAMAAAAEGELQQAFRTLLDQAKEARDVLSREIPTRAGEAESSFRLALDRIHEQALAGAQESLRNLVRQSLQRAEMEVKS